jgi:glycosyltransferase involved in cell wall biosynthesis
MMIAYACDPRGAGEHWLGWGWAEQAAQNFEVELITTPKARAAVEASCQPLGITPHFLEVPKLTRKLSELCGASWWRKLAWQKQVTRLAESLHRQKPFSVVHQTTFHTFRSPFPAASLGIPSVWGPIAGGEYVPPGFERYLGPARFGENARRLINRAWLGLPSIQRSLRDASALFVSNRTTLNFLPAEIHSKCTVVPPNALRPFDEEFVPPINSAKDDRVFNLLYVGNCVATRAIPLVFEALLQSGLENYKFTILGAGPALPHWRELARRLHLDEKVSFAGRVAHEQLQSFYAQAHVLVFPALRDSGGSALLEAMARHLPVVCLDWGGPGEMIDADSGLKVPVTEPTETVRVFAEGLCRLSREPNLRAALAAAARARAEKLFRWQAKRLLLEATYQRLFQKL